MRALAISNTLPWLDEDKVKLLRETYAKDLNPKQFEVFLEVAKGTRLNPFTREIYGTVVKGRLVIMTGIGGLRQIAHRSGDYMGMDPINIERDEKGNIISASCTVYKHVHGSKCAFSSEVLFSEYNTGKNNWASMPQTMISKVAEAHALRRAFPDLADLYTDEEMDQAKFKDVGGRVSQSANALFDEVEDVEAPEYIELEEEGGGNA